MKPSERRALDAEKRAQREAEAREKEIVDGKSRKNDGDKPRREGFAQSHVRIITFVICMLILIPVCLFGVDTLVAKHRESIFGISVTNKKNITVEEIISLANIGETLTWKDFDDYNYVDRSKEYLDENSKKKVTEYEREYMVDEFLVVKVTGLSLSGKPDTVKIFCYSKECVGYMVEIRGANVREFLVEHGYLK